MRLPSATKRSVELLPNLPVALGKGAVGLELFLGRSLDARQLGLCRWFGRGDPFDIGMLLPPFRHQRVGNLLPLLPRHLVARLDAFHLERGFAVAKTDNQIAVRRSSQLMARRIVSGERGACSEGKSECETVRKAHDRVPQ